MPVRIPIGSVMCLVAVTLSSACQRAQPHDDVEVARDTLANGAVALRYAALPEPAATAVGYDLRIGVVEGDPHEIFGDIRSIEVDGDGNIYALDHQSSEIRVFDPDGAYLRTITRQGRGPSELTAANGMILAAHDTLWVQDHGQWRILGIDLHGRELKQFPMPVMSYGYLWEGAIDNSGRFWNSVSHNNAPRVFPPEPGLNEGSMQVYLVSYDPASEAKDSVFVEERPYQSYVTRTGGGGWMYQSPPMSTNYMLLADPAGGFWTTSGASYSLTRRGGNGDTLLTVDVGIVPDAVTSEDRGRAIDRMMESPEGDLRVAEALAGLMPETKPVIDQIFLDDESRLWVRRRLEEGVPPRYDVFTQDGEYLDSVTLDFRPAAFLRPKVSGGRMYVVVRDDFEVPSIVRSDPLPIREANQR